MQPLLMCQQWNLKPLQYSWTHCVFLVVAHVCGMSKAITAKATNIFRNTHKFSICVLRYLESNSESSATGFRTSDELEGYIAKLAEIVREGLEDQQASDKLLQIRINMVLDDIGGKRRSTRIEAVLAEQVQPLTHVRSWPRLLRHLRTNSSVFTLRDLSLSSPTTANMDWASRLWNM